MKHLFLRFVLLTLLTLTFSAPAMKASAQEQPGGPDQPIIFTPLEESQLTDEQRNFLDKVKENRGIYHDGNFYVVALGPKPNPGYTIEFSHQEETFEQILVYVKLNKPDPDKNYADVIAYPYLAGTINLPKTVSISFINKDTGAPLFEDEPNPKPDEKWSEPNEDGVSYKMEDNKIILSWGEKPSSGYEINIKSLSRKNGVLTVTYTLREPEPDENTLTVITYPQDSARIPKGKDPVTKVVLVKKEDQSRVRVDVAFDNNEWTIHFNVPMDPKTLTSKYIYVTEKNDDTEEIFNTKLIVSKNKKTVTVKPLAEFRSGLTYYLHISEKVRSLSKKKLGKDYSLPYTPGNIANPVIEREFTFKDGPEGWSGGFADLPVDYKDNGYDLAFEYTDLPVNFGNSTKGLFISGHNRSDDLFMFIKRKLDQTDGIKPNTTYKVDVQFDLITNVAPNLVGIGGAPGESVYVKMGATTIEPVPVLNDTYYRMNIDKGQQASGGRDAIVIGNVAKIDSTDDSYQAKTMSGSVQVTTDDSGTLWLLIGTDSGFEGITNLYYTNIKVKLEEVHS